MFYSLEFLMNASTIAFTLAKLNQSTKYMLKVTKEMLGKGKSSKPQNDVNVVLVFNFK